jgi:hypothetical protein
VCVTCVSFFVSSIKKNKNVTRVIGGGHNKHKQHSKHSEDEGGTDGSEESSSTSSHQHDSGGLLHPDRPHAPAKAGTSGNKQQRPKSAVELVTEGMNAGRRILIYAPAGSGGALLAYTLAQLVRWVLLAAEGKIVMMKKEKRLATVGRGVGKGSGVSKDKYTPKHTLPQRPLPTCTHPPINTTHPLHRQPPTLSLSPISLAPSRY